MDYKRKRHEEYEEPIDCMGDMNICTLLLLITLGFLVIGWLDKMHAKLIFDT